MRKSTVKAVHLLKAAILLLSAVYCLFMPVMTGLGLLYNRASYGKFLTLTGVYFIVSALLMTAGTVMCGSRKKAKNVLSVIFLVLGFIICMVMLHNLCHYADMRGWSGKFEIERISSMYKRRIIPCVIPVTAAVILSAVRIGGRNEKPEDYTSIL